MLGKNIGGKIKTYSKVTTTGQAAGGVCPAVSDAAFPVLPHFVFASVYHSDAGKMLDGEALQRGEHGLLLHLPEESEDLSVAHRCVRLASYLFFRRFSSVGLASDQ